jgi:3-hydroxymyristoyl/3-hydroxydecanoyl-(acyl carrier protein) dehydratase
MPDPLPHRFPMRLVERVESAPNGRFAVVLATADGALTGPDPWPVTMAILLVVCPPRYDNLRLVALDRVVMHQSLVPGDRLEIEVEELGSFGDLRRYGCRGHRGGALAATAEITVSGS